MSEPRNGTELDRSNPGIIRHHKNRVRYKSHWRDSEDIKSRQHEALDDAAGKVNRAKIYVKLGAERKPTVNSIFRVNSVDEEVVTRVRSDRLIFMEAWQAGFSVSLRCAGRPRVYGCFYFGPSWIGLSHTMRFTRENLHPDGHCAFTRVGTREIATGKDLLSKSRVE